MRIRKRNKQPGMPPAQVEALGRCLPVDFEVSHKITAQLLAGMGAPAAGPQRSEDTAAGRVPPLLIGGESPQVTNPGKPVSRRVPSFLSEEDPAESIVLDRNNNPVIRPGVRLIDGHKVGVDWVSCVFEEVHAWRYYLNSDHLISMQSFQPTEPEQVAAFIKDIFAWILGVRETDEMRWKEFANGLNGYKYASAMPYQAGIVHTGHTSKTVLVTVTGQGALIATLGWETRLQWFLMGVCGWLTRIDFAYDDYEGEIYPVRAMRQKAINTEETKGCFQRKGRSPKIELRGAWEQDDPANQGLTLYVGSRMSGKYSRIYEKGKQQGLVDSPWVRFEIEMHSSAFQLTLDMLTSPTKYFCGAYPCCEWIEAGGEREPMKYKARCAVASVENSLNWIRHQAGGHLAYLRTCYSDTELLQLLADPDRIPAQLQAVDCLGDQVQKHLTPSASLSDESGLIEA